MNSPSELTRRALGSFTATDAASLAARLYEGRMDRVGEPEFSHVAAVAASVSDRAKVVGWLHDSVEDGLSTMNALRNLGVSPVDIEALTHLTRTPGRGTYMDYIRSIRDAAGVAGDIAREVKVADLRHNMSRPCPPEMLGMRAPDGRYDRALRILTDT